jgi:membrane protein implicated in regulation of membrane protease activity
MTSAFLDLVARFVGGVGQARGRQPAEDVVADLVGHRTEILTDATDDRVRVGVRMVLHRAHHRHPRMRHT